MARDHREELVAERQVGARVLDHQVDDPPEEATDRGRPRGGQPLGERRLLPAQELHQDVVLGGKVQVEGAAGDAGAADDVLDLGRPYPDPPELGQGGLEESVAGLEPASRPAREAYVRQRHDTGERRGLHGDVAVHPMTFVSQVLVRGARPFAP